MPHLKLTQGDVRDEIRNPLYDTWDLLNAVVPTTNSFFSIGGKDISLSNLRQNSQLESQVSYRCLGMSLDAQSIYAANSGVLPLVMENSSIQFKVGEKYYWQSNTTYVTGRIKQYSAAATPDAGPGIHDFMQHYGQEAVAPVVFSGKHVIDVPPLQSFSVVINLFGLTAPELTAATPSAGANTKVRFIFALKGLMRRPVQ